MKSRKRNQKPSTRYNETVIEGYFDVRLLNTWEAASLIVYLNREERQEMSKAFRFQMMDMDVNLRHVSQCLEIGRAMDQRFRRDQGIQIDFELKRVADGISILLHVITLYTDDGRPRYVMAARDGEGKFLMEGGRQVMIPAALTFERHFPADRIDYLFDLADDLSYVMQARRLRRIFRSNGDQKSLQEMRRSLSHFQDVSEEVKVERLTASAGEISASKDKPKKDKRPKIGAPKVAAPPPMSQEARTDELARKLVVAAGLEDPGEGIVETETAKPAETAASTPSEAPKPKKDKTQRPKLTSLKDLASLKDRVLPGTSNGSNGQ